MGENKKKQQNWAQESYPVHAIIRAIILYNVHICVAYARCAQAG